ncbi:MAG: hypothetical protein GX421_06515 [Caldisericales bacterium]|nr:hypothetical protein [Caldisericales bacterium]
MTNKPIVAIVIGTTLAPFGLLWLSQETDFAHIKAILCFANYKLNLGKSLQWKIMGAIFFSLLR